MTRDFHRLCRDHQWTLLKFQRGFSRGLTLHKWFFSFFGGKVLGIPLLDIIKIHRLPAVIFNVFFWEVNASILGIRFKKIVWDQFDEWHVSQYIFSS